MKLLPSVLCRVLVQLFDNAQALFSGDARRLSSRKLELEARMVYLDRRLAMKDGVIAKNAKWPMGCERAGRIEINLNRIAWQ
jgi:hypothetical protein